MAADKDQRLKAWRAYVEHQFILPEVRPVVAASWQRCSLSLNPYQRIHLNQLSTDHLLATQVMNFDLLSIARPIIEDIYQHIENSQSAVILVNSAGYILDLIGSPQILAIAENLGMIAGGLFSESQVGTNAFGLALTQRIPIQIGGAEHFLQQFHELAGASSPIFDLTGRPLGALGIITPAEQEHPHTLALAAAGARAIEGQRQADFLLAERNDQLTELNAILASVPEGVLVWNADGKLMHANTVALKIIDMPARSVMGRPVAEFVSYSPSIRGALQNRKSLTNVDAHIKIGDRHINCVLSIRFIENERGLQWIIVLLQQEKEVRQLIHQQYGAQALATLDDLLGESPEMKRVRRITKTAAAASAGILIRGESGTGKNILASAIHNESNRREGPFLIFSCSSIPSEQVVTELVGYDEGVSSKRPGGRPSKFELAQGGTLFFQDLDALPVEAQAILLNVLEMGIVQRRGSDRPVPVDVRVIAATSANIEALIAQGSFRADLVYRLSSFEITLPPLRERIKDLPLLAEKILTRLSRQINRPLRFADGVMELLKQYPWPGNIRELESVVGRAVVHAGASEVIGPMHFPKYLQESFGFQLDAPKRVTFQSLNEMEREAVLQTARTCKGNVAKMARVLGVSRTTVWRRMKEFNISPDDFRSKSY